MKLDLDVHLGELLTILVLGGGGLVAFTRLQTLFATLAEQFKAHVVEDARRFSEAEDAQKEASSRIGAVTRRQGLHEYRLGQLEGRRAPGGGA